MTRQLQQLEARIDAINQRPEQDDAQESPAQDDSLSADSYDDSDEIPDHIPDNNIHNYDNETSHEVATEPPVAPSLPVGTDQPVNVQNDAVQRARDLVRHLDTTYGSCLGYPGGP